MQTRNRFAQVTTLKGPNIRVEMDTSEIFRDDPGQGTPVLVICSNGDSGTFDCVSEQGETVDGTQLTDAQKQWLASVTPQVEEWCLVNGI